jgi:hypothetical protein
MCRICAALVPSPRQVPRYTIVTPAHTLLDDTYTDANVENQARDSTFALLSLMHVAG